jgi:cell division transport system ATP-binding protein
MEEARLFTLSGGGEQGKLLAALPELQSTLPASPIAVKAGSHDPIVRLSHVSKHYGPKKALDDVTLDIARNDFLFICGPSGAGKSTLLKLLYLGERASSGQILVDGINLAHVTRSRIPLLRRKFGIVFQDFKLIRTRTVFENIALVLEAGGCKQPLIARKVMGMLRSVGLEDRAGTYPRSLSGGEQQRVAIARAMIGRPKIILADEPGGSLDRQAAGSAFRLLKQCHSSGTTVVVATHDRSLMKTIGGRQVLLTGGALTPPADAASGGHNTPARKTPADHLAPGGL